MHTAPDGLLGRVFFSADFMGLLRVAACGELGLTGWARDEVEVSLSTLVPSEVVSLLVSLVACSSSFGFDEGALSD